MARVRDGFGDEGGAGGGGGAGQEACGDAVVGRGGAGGGGGGGVGAGFGAVGGAGVSGALYTCSYIDLLWVDKRKARPFPCVPDRDWTVRWTTCATAPTVRCKATACRGGSSGMTSSAVHHLKCHRRSMTLKSKQLHQGALPRHHAPRQGTIGLGPASCSTAVSSPARARLFGLTSVSTAYPRATMSADPIDWDTLAVDITQDYESASAGLWSVPPPRMPSTSASLYSRSPRTRSRACYSGAPPSPSLSTHQLPT